MSREEEKKGRNSGPGVGVEVNIGSLAGYFSLSTSTADVIFYFHP